MHNFTIENALEPKDGYLVYTDKYWLCVDGDPTKALFYQGLYPQCNCRIRAEGLLWRLNRYPDAPKNVSIVLIKIAYVKPFE